MTTPTNPIEAPADPLQAAYAVADAFAKWQAEPDIAPNEGFLNALHDLCDALPGWPDGERVAALSSRPPAVPGARALDAAACDSQWLINRCEEAIENAATPNIPNAERAAHLTAALRMIRGQAKASIAAFAKVKSRAPGSES
jgi:hypothetical protein